MFKFDIKVDLSGVERQLMRDFGVGSDAQRLWSEIVFFGSVPYMPFVTGTFVNLSIAASTELFKYGELLYPGPYAHFLWQGIVFVDSVTGSTWARAGTTKIPIDKELQYNREANPKATGQWVIVAANDNLVVWLENFQKAINAGIVR